MNENFETVRKYSKKGTPYLEWQNIPGDRILREEHVGRRVWIAGEPSSTFRILCDIHHKGDKGWLDCDGYTAKTFNSHTRCVTTLSCRLHPSEYLSVDLASMVDIKEYDNNCKYNCK